jgi:hypothetical protein
LKIDENFSFLAFKATSVASRQISSNIGGNGGNGGNGAWQTEIFISLKSSYLFIKGQKNEYQRFFFFFFSFFSSLNQYFPHIPYVASKKYNLSLRKPANWTQDESS